MREDSRVATLLPVLLLLIAPSAAAMEMPLQGAFGEQGVKAEISGSHVWVESPLFFEGAELTVTRRGEDQVWTAAFGRGASVSVDVAELLAGELSDGQYDYHVRLALVPPGGLGAVDSELVGSFDVAGGSIQDISVAGLRPAAAPMTLEHELVTRHNLVEGHLRVTGYGCYGCESGTTVTAGKVDIYHSNDVAAIQFHGENTTFRVGKSADDFAIVQGKNSIFFIENGAPGGSLRIASNGRIGVGTTAPAHRLHVRRADGTAKVQVTEASGTTASRELFKLENNGAPFFVFANNAIARSTSFAQGSTGHFIISHQQVSGVQLRLDLSGNLIIQGTLTQGSSRDFKTDVIEIDPHEILAKIDEIPLATWSYTEEAGKKRHLGPMAEDFHRVFGLGGNPQQLAPSDVASVALAAVQALRDDNRSLRQTNEDLASRLAILEEMVLRQATEASQQAPQQ